MPVYRRDNSNLVRRIDPIPAEGGRTARELRVIVQPLPARMLVHDVQVTVLRQHRHDVIVDCRVGRYMPVRLVRPPHLPCLRVQRVELSVPAADVQDAFQHHGRGGEYAAGGELPLQFAAVLVQRQHSPVPQTDEHAFSRDRR